MNLFFPYLLKIFCPRQRGNFRRRFEAGIDGLDVNWLHQVLADSCDSKHSSIRHDIDFHTPSGQDRRFIVWISKDADGVHDVDRKRQKDLKFFEGSRAIGSAVVKLDQGTISSNFSPRLSADVALPTHKFDCRLLIRTGQFTMFTCSNSLIIYRITINGFNIPVKF